MNESPKVNSAELSSNLVKIIDDLSNTGNWQSSLFLRNANKKLQDLKQEALALQEQTQTKRIVSTHEDAVPEGKEKVYISLYQIDGDNLQTWFHTIKALVSYNISRPTYANEKNVKELIASKTDSKRHGYVIAIVDKIDVINIDPPLVDSFGNELLILKEGAIAPENLLEFIHSNKFRYKIGTNELSFIEEVDRK